MMKKEVKDTEYLQELLSQYLYQHQVNLTNKETTKIFHTQNLKKVHCAFCWNHICSDLDMVFCVCDLRLRFLLAVAAFIISKYLSD